MALEDTLSNWSGIGLNVGIILILIFLVGGILVASVWFYLRWRRFSEYQCVIWERDGFGQLVQKFDRAGVFVDKKTNNKRFFMQKANVGLSPDNIPYIPTSKGKKLVYLGRYGLKNFFFIKPEFPTENQLILKVGEEDVNWAINAYERQKRLFSQNTLLQYLPFILLAFVSIIILVIFIYFFKEFKTLAAVADAMREAAKVMTANSMTVNGTVVLT